MVIAILRVVPKYLLDVGRVGLVVPFLRVLALGPICPWVLAMDPFGYPWARRFSPLMLARFWGCCLVVVMSCVVCVVCSGVCMHGAWGCSI